MCTSSSCLLWLSFFFFSSRRRHTRFDCDWSSDVCSSDLAKLPPAVRWVVRRMGGHRTTAVDFLSYLLFDPAYTTALIELGYADGRAEWPRIEQFLAAVAE